MKIIVPIFLLLVLACPIHAADEFYAAILADTQATFSNNGTCTVQKDDAFPFIGYDPSQMLVQLKFGPLTFWVRKSNIAFVSEADTPAVAKKYLAETTKFNEAWQQQLAQQAKAQQQAQAQQVQTQQALQAQALQQQQIQQQQAQQAAQQSNVRQMREYMDLMKSVDALDDSQGRNHR